MVARKLFIPTTIALTNFSIFLNSVLVSQKFQCLVLVYQNQTQSYANEILSNAGAQSRQTLIINVDLKFAINKYHAVKNSTTTNKYFVISVIGRSFEKYIYQFIDYLPLNAHHSLITKTKQMNFIFIRQLLLYLADILNDFKMFTITLLEVITDNNLRLHSTVGYDEIYVFTVNPMNYIKNMDQFLDKFYFMKFNNMKSMTLSIFGLYSIPYLFPAKRYNKELKEFEIGAGGVDVYIATLITEYLNATLVFSTLNTSFPKLGGQLKPIDVALIAPTEETEWANR